MQLKKEIVLKLAKKYNVPQYKIEDVINSYFGLAAFTLRNGISPEDNKYPVIAIPYFGKFYPPENKIIKYNEAIRNKGLRS